MITWSMIQFAQHIFNPLIDPYAVIISTTIYNMPLIPTAPIINCEFLCCPMYLELSFLNACFVVSASAVIWGCPNQRHYWKQT